MDVEVPLDSWGSGTASSRVVRHRDTVVRITQPWTPSVHALLRHLEQVGFSGAPRVVGDGTTDDGRAVVSYVEGESPHPRAWSDAGVHGVGVLLRAAHDAAASFDPPAGSTWQPWWGRAQPGDRSIVGHCDPGPWNIVAVDGIPTALIDWEYAGPVDAGLDLVHAAWLNAQLHDEGTAERWGLPEPGRRAVQLRLLLDGYGVPSVDREHFVDQLAEFAVRDAAAEARAVGVGPDSNAAVTSDGYPAMWAIAWRTLSADWILRHRHTLQRAIS